MNHDHTDNCTKIQISAKYLCRADRDQDRQKNKCRIRKQVKDRICTGLLHCRINLTKSFQNPHQQTARYDRRNDRNKYISQCLYCTPPKARLCACCLSDFFPGKCADARDLDKFVVNLVDRSCPENNLQLSGREKDSLHTVDCFDCFLAALVIVSDDQTQSRRTVLSADDIFPASYVVTDLLCCFPVIHGNPRPLFSRHFVNSRFRQKEYTSFQATYTSSSDNPFFRLPELSLRLYEIEITPLRLQILFLQLFLPKCFAQHSPGF
ncbi:Uncharacterised protein [uncultured Clostridium sp.]|nr:Uncharacterised protein [uncultured Clostridium sp.]